MPITPESSGSKIGIDDLIVDTGSRSVLRGDETLKISGLTFDFLLALAEASPAMITYEMLVEKVWQNRPVTPETIAQRAKLLRDALSDDAHCPRYIELVRGRGYRLLPAVETRDESVEAKRPARRVIVAILAVVAAVLVVLRVFLPLEQPTRSVAVSPFVDLSPDGDQAHFGDGIAQELIDKLTRLNDVRVVSLMSSHRHDEGGRADPRVIGKALNVATILQGSVRKTGNRLRISAQLVDTQDGSTVWTNTYTREISDIFAIQDEIAAAVAGELGVSFGVGDANAFRGAGTSSVEAYQSYLRAIREPWGERIRLLERAIQLDPDYGAALAALGLSIAATRWRHQPEKSPEIHDRAFRTLMRAVEVDPESAYAYSLLATGSYGRYDWTRSEEYYQKALKIQPDGEMLEHFGNMRMRAGRSKSALTVFEDAASSLRHPIVGVGLLDINAYLALQRYADIERLIDDRALEPDVSLANLNYLLALNRGNAVALRASIEELAIAGDPIGTYFTDLLLHFDSPAAMIASLQALYADETTLWPSKYHDIALLAAFFGDPEFALAVFSVEARVLTVRYGALWYPVMAESRRLPAFNTLVTDVNLVDYWRTYGWADHCQPVGDEDFECF